MRVCAAIVAGVVLVVSAQAGAGIYKWVDAQGRMHFTQELSQVPPEHREEAVRRTLEDAGEPNRVQTFSSDAPSTAPAPGAAPAAAQTPAVPAAPAPGGAAAGKTVYRIRVERAGTSLRVGVRLNNAVVAPFLVDTGASDVAIPRWVADQLGLRPTGRTRQYQTANGVVEEPVVMLDTVDLGGAVARDVPASISSTMPIGLLGLSFFNHFTYHVDAAQGILTLVPNDLAAEGRIKGGRSEAQWRAEFDELRLRRARIRTALERTESHKSRKRRELEAALADLDRQLGVLEAEADEAHVPMTWRD